MRALEAARAGRSARARALVLGAVELLEGSPNRLWLLSAYRDAAEIVVERREEFRGRAAVLRRAVGIPAPESN